MAQAVPHLARPLTTAPPQAGVALWSSMSFRPGMFMEAFFVSTSLVALAEIGDKTQLLAFILAARFRRPVPIMLGILTATLFNHGLAGSLGAWIASAVDPAILRTGLGLSFLAMAVWMLIPDQLDSDTMRLSRRLGVFGTTLLAFFFAEMGDKTQIATVAMASHYAALIPVVGGSTLGMMIANVPAVLIGERLAQHLPTRRIHQLAAALFALLGGMVLLGLGG